ncbi:MAG TPA: hypothetical protein VIS49_04265 [Cyclobacteriaceae bacterium]
MKTILTLLSLFIFFACQQQNNTANETYEKNAQTVLANLKGWQNENLDYSMYADDFVMRDTGFNGKDSVDKETMMKYDQEIWKNYDFKLLNEPALLPGVNADTRQPDGSVRHYSDWEVTRTATDSTQAKSGVIKMYESFDFNEEGKIIYQQTYGDFTGLMMYLNDDDNGMQ